MTEARPRTLILQEAERVITTERHDQYGDSQDAFALIAEMWSSWLGTQVSGYDVAMMMTLLKIARSRHNPGHSDNVVDLCGYAALAWEQVPSA